MSGCGVGAIAPPDGRFPSLTQQRGSAAIFANEQNRYRGVAHDVLRIASHHDPPQSPAAVGATYDEVRRPLFCRFDDVFPGCDSHGLPKFRLDGQPLLTRHRFRVRQDRPASLTRGGGNFFVSSAVNLRLAWLVSGALSVAVVSALIGLVVTMFGGGLIGPLMGGMAGGRNRGTGPGSGYGGFGGRGSGGGSGFRGGGGGFGGGGASGRW